MHRVLILLLAFLPALCHADTINYQINVTGNWTETNPACVSNCTETINMSYEFELNQDVFNLNSPNADILGWIVESTLKVNSSGFLGSFSPSVFAPSLWTVYDNALGLSQGYPIYNSQRDEVDLANPAPGLLNTSPTTLLLYNCPYSNDCVDAYPGVDPEYILANNTTATVVPVPAGDSAWELLLISAIACTAGLFVKHRSA